MWELDFIGEANFVAAVGLVGGIMLGLAARIGRFCTLGAIEDLFYGGSHTRIRMWGLALGIAISGSFLLAQFGALEIQESIYLSRQLNPITSILGGLIFGYGMAIAGNCGFGALARLGGGDLRSFVIVLVMGIVAYATLSGPVAWLRMSLWESPQLANSPQGIAHLLDQFSGIHFTVWGTAIGLLIAVTSLSSRSFYRNGSAIIWSIVVAGAVLSAWAGTSYVAKNGFNELPVVSHSFAAPVGETILYTMTATGGGLSFAIGSVLGVCIGAFLGSMFKGQFRWEACEDSRELLRQIFGAALMGFGAVLSLGCSIGQGLSAFSVLAFSAPLTLGAIFIGARLGLKHIIEGPVF